MIEYWDDIILLTVSAYTLIKALTLLASHRNVQIGLYVIALISFLINTFTQSFGYELLHSELPETINEWSRIISISFILSGLALLIRNSKPKISQFPSILSFTPLLLIVGQYFVFDTLVLKEWLIAIYQGGALFISLLMCAMLSRKHPSFTLILIGLIFFLLSFLFYWISLPEFLNTKWAWKICVGLGMISIVGGVERGIQDTSLKITI